MRYIIKQEYQDMQALLDRVPLLEPKVLGALNAESAGEALQIAAKRYGIDKPLLGVFLPEQDQGQESEGQG